MKIKEETMINHPLGVVSLQEIQNDVDVIARKHTKDYLAFTYLTVQALIDKIIELQTSIHQKTANSTIKTPFEKLKELWKEYQSFNGYNNGFEYFLYTQVESFFSPNFKKEEIHSLLAQHCGFKTTAEVRRAIEQLKNTNVFDKTSDDIPNSEL